MNKNGHGGRRAGAGRKPKGKRELAGSVLTRSTTTDLTPAPTPTLMLTPNHDLKDSTFVYHVPPNTLRSMPEFQIESVNGWWDFLADCDAAKTQADMLELAKKYAETFTEMHPDEPVLETMNMFRDSLLTALRYRHDYCLKNDIGRFAFLGSGIKVPTLEDVHVAGVRLTFTLNLPCLRDLMSDCEKAVADAYVKCFSFKAVAEELDMPASTVRAAWLKIKEHCRIVNARLHNSNAPEYAALRELERAIVADEREDEFDAQAKGRGLMNDGGVEIYKHDKRRGGTFDRSRIRTSGRRDADDINDETGHERPLHDDYDEESGA